MENRNSERFFAELAKAYAENEGAALNAELARLKAENRLLPTTGLESKIKSKQAANKFRSYALRSLPLAASLMIALLVYSSYHNGLQSPTPKNQPPPTVATAPPAAMPAPTPSPEPPPMEIESALQLSVKLVSASLPAGYTLSGVDYDNEAAIMEITNETSNRIVLRAEPCYDFDKDGFTVIKVNGTPAYGLVKSDYCLLKYAKDDMLYTLTSMYDYGDLIEIIENF
jgi:hypothetical protein